MYSTKTSGNKKRTFGEINTNADFEERCLSHKKGCAIGLLPAVTVLDYERENFEVLNAEENFSNDYQLVLDKLSQMIYESKPITMEERGEIVHVLNDQRIRESVTEILMDIKAPKRIHNLDCLKLLSDVIRFLLTLFVHE